MKGEGGLVSLILEWVVVVIVLAAMAIVVAGFISRLREGGPPPRAKDAGAQP